VRSLGQIPRWAAVGALALGVAAAVAACQQGDSILLVEVGGDLSLTVTQLNAAVTANGQTHVLLVPPTPTVNPISLPTSFTVELDRSITGPVTISITAFDDTGSTVASGVTTQMYINTGGQTIIAVTLETGVQP
jgi:uncharacterized protein YraI